MTRCRYGKENRDVDEWWNAINAERYALCGVPQTSHFDGHCCDIHDVNRDLSRKQRFAAGNTTTGAVRARIFLASALIPPLLFLKSQWSKMRKTWSKTSLQIIYLNNEKLLRSL